MVFAVVRYQHVQWHDRVVIDDVISCSHVKVHLDPVGFGGADFLGSFEDCRGAYAVEFQ